MAAKNHLVSGSMVTLAKRELGECRGPSLIKLQSGYDEGEDCWIGNKEHTDSTRSGDGLDVRFEFYQTTLVGQQW